MVFFQFLNLDNYAMVMQDNQYILFFQLFCKSKIISSYNFKKIHPWGWGGGTSGDPFPSMFPEEII